MITIKKNSHTADKFDYEQFKYLKKALAKEDKRFNLTCIKIENTEKQYDTAIATDGVRMHKADISKRYEAGLYHVISLTAGLIVLEKYENRDAIFPDCTKYFNLDGYNDYFYVGTPIGVAYGVHLKGIYVKMDFIEQAYNGYENATVYFKDTKSPIFIIEKNRTSAIMPFEIERIEYKTKEVETLTAKE